MSTATTPPTGGDSPPPAQGAAPSSRRIRGPIGTLWHHLGSLRITVFLLAFSTLLVFLGTLDQVQYGIRLAQERYFESFFAIWQYPAQWPGGTTFLAHLGVPLLGGYFVGPLLVINLVAAHFRFFRPSPAKIGIVLIHAGVVLLLVSQLVTQLVQKEYYMWLKEGGSANYLESFVENELVLINHSAHPGSDLARVVSIPIDRVQAREAIRHPALPFTIVPREFFLNAAISRREGRQGLHAPLADRGLAARFDLVVEPRPRVTQHNERDVTTAVVEIIADNRPLGRWLLSNVFDDRFAAQTFEFEGQTWEIALRIQRQYLPFTLELHEFIHERYPGTNIPRRFASRMLLHDGTHQEPIETTVQMNEPLRYGGYTFYQASFTPDDTASMLQVVRNPGWTGPYIACSLITLGMIIQFWISLSRFTRRRANAEKEAAAALNPNPTLNLPRP